ncbi:MAG: hypothetical protein KDK71_01520 [Chlamydiia bacterium]|nr:hypothetical protein [Chlamydiia bacterium]
MKNKGYRSYILLGLLLLALFYLPLGMVRAFRGSARTVSSLYVKSGAKKGLDSFETENLLLKKQNEALRRRLYAEERVDHQIKKIKELIKIDEKKQLEFFQRRKKAAIDLLDLELFSLTAEVVHRDRGEWNSTLWIGVGKADNIALEKEVVVVGSPVLKGQYLIGVVEEVSQHQSRVRLLTDGALVPSVRVAGKGTEKREFESLVKELYSLAMLKGLSQDILDNLNKLVQSSDEEKEEKFLAKGELLGSRFPFCRIRSEVLRGVGFNYDFEDDEGAPLELRSGKEMGDLTNNRITSLIEEGDLLVTTGMDGVFPKDIPVAYVSYIAPLKEGSPTYEIEANLCAGNLEHLLHVSVLPPLIR